MSILEKIANTASAVYKSTAMKVGGVLLAGSLISGCFKDYFTSVFPLERWQAELTIESDGWGIRGQVKSEESEKNSAEFTHTESETEVEATGNTATEKRTSFDFSVKPSNRRSFTLRPMIESLEKEVLTPAGVRESKTTGTFAAVDVSFGGAHTDSNSLLIRPYANTEEEKSVAGDLTMKQSGVYVRGKYGVWRPLLSLESYDFGAGIPKASEVQAGTSFGNDNHSLGYFLAFMDDGTDQEVKHVLVGDATLVSSGNNFHGVDISYDGALFGIGAHGAWSRRGANMPQTAKRFKKGLRGLQDLTFLERGRPQSVAGNMRSDAAKLLQNIDDVTLFYLLGIRQEYDLGKDDNVAKFYAMAGTNIRGVTAGATFGNVFEVYPADAVKGRGGAFAGMKLGGGRLNFAWEKIDFENRKDMSAFTVLYMVPFR